MICVVVSLPTDGKYVITFSATSINIDWTIERSFAEIKVFQDNLTASGEYNNILPFASSEGEVSAEIIQNYLSELLRCCNFMPWDNSIIRNFVADGEIPQFVKLEMRAMKNEVTYLSQKNSDLEQRLHQLEIMMSKYHSLFHSLAEGKTESIRPQLLMSSVSIDSFDTPADRRRGFSSDRQNSGSSRGQNDDVAPVVPTPTLEPQIPPVITEKIFNEIMNDYPMCKDFEREAEDIVRSVQPRDAQFRFRNSAAMMIKDQITKALNSNAFDVSFYGLKCFLPDDPIKLTVILNHTTIATWHKVLYDRLIIVSEHHCDRNDQDQTNTLKVRDILSDEEEERIHKIKDVRLTSDSNTFKVLGMIDSIPFEIVANSRVELCMLTFFEEINALVGNDHLLKRSVLLIRSWWMYETSQMTEKSLKEYLPDFAIWLMVTALFNEHYAVITSPIQALYLFLSVYSQYDGSTQAITLYGMRTFLPNSSNLPIEHNYKNYLINQKLFEKYYQVVNIQNTAALQEFNHSKHVKVDRCGFNVIHPFTFVSMTLEKLSSRKTEKILNCFKTASNTMKDLFKQVHIKDSTDNVVAQATFKVVLFPETMKKIHAINWRPDSISNQTTSVTLDEMEMLRSPRDVFDVQIGELWHHILYCNFILEAIVSESALLSLCTEVLTEKKILPVGEVGKTLSDVTAIPNLSSQLREKFGGLKKFLERYPEIFIFSKDHPFNPNVVLRKSLTSEQIDQVERGLVSLQAIFKNIASSQKQQAAISKKGNNSNNNKTSQGNNANVVNNNPTGGLPMNFQESFQRSNATSNIMQHSSSNTITNNNSVTSGLGEDRSPGGFGMHQGRIPANMGIDNRRSAHNWTPFMENLSNSNSTGAGSNDWNNSNPSPDGNNIPTNNPSLSSWMAEFSDATNNNAKVNTGGANSGFNDEHSHGSLNSSDSWTTRNSHQHGHYPSTFDQLSKRGAIRISNHSTNSLGPNFKPQQSHSSQSLLSISSQQPRPHSWEIGYGSAYRPLDASPTSNNGSGYGEYDLFSVRQGGVGNISSNNNIGVINKKYGSNSSYNMMYGNDPNDSNNHYHMQSNNNTMNMNNNNNNNNNMNAFGRKYQYDWNA